MKPEDSNSTVIVSLDHVDARIEQRLVLRDVSLQLRSGRHLGIVGANGSGKTTLLRLIGGTHWPAPGSGKRVYEFDGRRHRDAVEARKRITLVGPELQDSYARLGWNFTAGAVVITGLHRTEIPRRTMTRSDLTDARALLDLLDASGLIDRPFLELSRGEQRRVLIARALGFRPEVLLLDEPGSGLDTGARRDLDRAINRAAQQATIVASAHSTDLLPGAIREIVEVRDHAVRPLEPPPVTSGSATNPAVADQTVRTQLRATVPIAELSKANVWVGDRLVLRDITWRLEQNEHWLVTGRNGAGKSTLLRVLHGQIRPARGGTITWPALGNPRNVWELRRNIGWVSPELQAEYRFPTTVAQCVASGFQSSVGQTRRLSDAQRRRRDALLRGFGLDDLRDRLLSKLSYGQARRALLARTLAREPRLLLLDEPWEGLDPKVVEIVLAQLRVAMRNGTQIVCASHVGDGGLELTRTMAIRDGAVSECGPV
jgi:molybdate transport system ATP-binding protein